MINVCPARNTPEYEEILKEFNGSRTWADFAVHDYWRQTGSLADMPDAKFVKELKDHLKLTLGRPILPQKPEKGEPADIVQKTQTVNDVLCKAAEELQGFSISLRGAGRRIWDTKIRDIVRSMGNYTFSPYLSPQQKIRLGATNLPPRTQGDILAEGIHSAFSKLLETHEIIDTLGDSDFVISERTNGERAIVTMGIAFEPDRRTATTSGIGGASVTLGEHEPASLSRTSSWWRLDRTQSSYGGTRFDSLNGHSADIREEYNRRNPTLPEVKKRYFLPVSYTLDANGDFAFVRQPSVPGQGTENGTTLYPLCDTAFLMHAIRGDYAAPSRPAGAMKKAVLFERRFNELTSSIRQLSETLKVTGIASPETVQAGSPENSWAMENRFPERIQAAADFIEGLVKDVLRQPYYPFATDRALASLRPLAETLKDLRGKQEPLSTFFEGVWGETPATADQRSDAVQQIIDRMQTALDQAIRTIEDRQKKQLLGALEPLKDMMYQIVRYPEERQEAIEQLVKEKGKFDVMNHEDWIQERIEQNRQNMSDERARDIDDRMRDCIYALYGINNEHMSPEDAGRIYGKGVVDFLRKQWLVSSFTHLMPVKEMGIFASKPLQLMGNARRAENTKVKEYSNSLQELARAYKKAVKSGAIPDGTMEWMLDTHTGPGYTRQTLVRATDSDLLMRTVMVDARKSFAQRGTQMSAPPFGQPLTPAERKTLWRDCVQEEFLKNTSEPPDYLKTMREKLLAAADSLIAMDYDTKNVRKQVQDLLNSSNSVQEIRLQLRSMEPDAFVLGLLHALDTNDLHMRIPSAHFKNPKYDAIMALPEDDPRRRFYTLYTQMMDEYNLVVPEHRRLTDEISNAPDVKVKKKKPKVGAFDVQREPWEGLDPTGGIPLPFSSPMDEGVATYTQLFERLMKQQASLIHYREFIPALFQTKLLTDQMARCLDGKKGSDEYRLQKEELDKLLKYIDKEGLDLTKYSGWVYKWLNQSLGYVGWSTLGFQVSTALHSHWMSLCSLHGNTYGIREHFKYTDYMKAATKTNTLIGHYIAGDKKKTDAVCKLFFPERDPNRKKGAKDFINSGAYAFLHATDSCHRAILSETMARGTELYDKDGNRLGNLWKLLGKDVRVPEEAVQVMTDRGLRPWTIEYTRALLADVVSANVYTTDLQHKSGMALDPSGALAVMMKNLGLNALSQYLHGPQYDFNTGKFEEGAIPLLLKKAGTGARRHALYRALMVGPFLERLDRLFKTEWASGLFGMKATGAGLTPEERRSVDGFVKSMQMSWGLWIGGTIINLLMAQALGGDSDRDYAQTMIKQQLTSPGLLMGFPDRTTKRNILGTVKMDQLSFPRWIGSYLAGQMMSVSPTLNPLGELKATFNEYNPFESEITGSKIAHLAKFAFYGTKAAFGDTEVYSKGSYKHLFYEKWKEEGAKTLGAGWYDVERMIYPSNTVQRVLNPPED